MPLKLSPTQLAFNARGDGKFSLPFQEQIDFLQKKLNLPTEKYNDIIKGAHDRAFVVAGAAKADLLTDIHNAINKTAAEGKSIGWFKKEFEGIVQKHGWEGWTGSDTKKGRDWRARVIYKTNLSASYSAARYEQAMHPDMLKSRPYWKYIHNDTVAHPRTLHKEWSGTVLKYDDPWWSTHRPPNGIGCRCRFEPVPASEYTGDTAPDNGTYTKTDRFGVTHTIPNGIDFGWDYGPGENRATPLKNIIDQKLIRFPAPIGADMWQALKPALAMESALQWHNTLDQWLSTSQAGRVAVVGAIDPQIVEWLSNKQTAPLTAEIAIREGLIRGSKQARHEKAGDGLTEMEWRQLPSIIDNPDLVLFDTQTGKLLYIAASTDAGTKLAIEFDYIKKGEQAVNMIVSGFRQSREIIAEKIRGGIYELVK